MRKTTLALALLFACAALPSFAQLPAPATPRIHVTGEATVYVKPDKILINLGIETWDMEIVAAKTKNNEILAKAIDVITDAGVAEKDIQTDQLSIEPRWRDNVGTRQDPQIFLGYFVRNSLVVTLTDVSKVENLVTEVLEAGVNYILGIDFQSTEFKKYREEARELALKAAREKAQKMAAVLDADLGPVSEIRDHGSGSSGYYPSWGGGGGFGGGGGQRGYAMSQNTAIEVSGGSGENSETIALGKIAITASVSVSFELKP